MKNLIDAVLLAETISTKKDKHQVLSGVGPADQRLIYETFNVYRVFNIRKYDWPKAFANSDDPTYSKFLSLLDQLANRDLTGNSAKTAVTAVLSQYTERTAKILARVIDKDLKCGASGDTFQKLYPDLKIPSFELMLAGKIEEIGEETAESRKTKKVILTEAILSKKYKLTFPLLAESKYDGNRLLAMVKNGTVDYLSRSGKPSDHCEGLFDAELIRMEIEIGEPFVLDGEVLAGSFQETMNAKGSDSAKAKQALRFWAFDIMTLREWKARNCVHSQKHRSSKIEVLVAKLGLTKIIKSKYKICNNLTELKTFYGEILAEGVNDDGMLNGLGEGLIIKNLHALYEWDRSKFWMKWKPVIDLDLEVVGFETGKGRLSQTIGKLKLSGKDENGNVIVCNCGSGLNDKMRDYILKNQSIVLGKIVMIEAQEISLAEGSNTYSARFPVFIRFRDDK